MKNDTPTHRVTIDELQDGTLEAMLEDLRRRRIQAAMIYKEGLALRNEILTEKARVRLSKQLDILNRELVSTDKSIKKLEDRVLRVRALRLEIEGM